MQCTCHAHCQTCFQKPPPFARSCMTVFVCYSSLLFFLQSTDTQTKILFSRNYLMITTGACVLRVGNMECCIEHNMEARTILISNYIHLLCMMICVIPIRTQTKTKNWVSKNNLACRAPSNQTKIATNFASNSRVILSLFIFVDIAAICGRFSASSKIIYLQNCLLATKVCIRMHALLGFVAKACIRMHTFSGELYFTHIFVDFRSWL